MRLKLLLANICCVILFSSYVKAQDAASAGAGSVPTVVPFVTSAEVTSKKLASEVDFQFPSLYSMLVGANISTASDLQHIELAIETYTTSKMACAKAADTAEGLCIESKSPQALSAKGIVDSIGPALEKISSAFGSCNLAASKSQLVKDKTDLAKDACVASKVICDGSCAKAAGQLKEINANTTAFINATKAEITAKITPACQTPPYKMCKEISEASLALDTFAAAVPPALQAEAAATPVGTTASIAVRCQGYSKDIALYATNIAAALVAKQSAQSCADQLNNGSTASKEEYCKISANAGTSFCKCQKDNTLEGCVGYTAKAVVGEKIKDDTAKDIKNIGSKNQFAGGFGKNSSIDLGKLKSDLPMTAEDYKKAADSKTDAATANPAGSVGGGPSGGNSGGSVNAKDAVGSDDKKKSFGSFFGGGGGGSSASGSGKGSNYGLGKKDMAQLQRQIASEKLRAEVSGASGKSNWEKVSERYLRNSSSLLVGQ